MNTNVNQMKAEMQKISRKMATCFNDQITTKELIKWHVESNSLLFDYNKENTCASDFLASFGYVFLPSLLDMNSPKKIQAFLEEELPDLFGGTCYKGLKMALMEIGNAFFICYSKLTSGAEEVVRYMKVQTCLMSLSEMYANYEHLQDEVYEEEKRLKAA